MNKSLKNQKKQILVEIEENTLEFFASKIYELADYKNMFSLVVPGYPSNFTMNGFLEFEHSFQNDLDKEKKLSLVFCQNSVENYENNLTISVFFEIEELRKINFITDKNFLTTEINSDLFSNPYSLFFFDDYMKSNFKKLKNNKDIQILKGKKFGNFNFQYVLYTFLENFLKITNVIKAKPQNNNFIFFVFFLVFLEYKALSYSPFGHSFLPDPDLFCNLFIFFYRILCFNGLVFFLKLLFNNKSIYGLCNRLNCSLNGSVSNNYGNPDIIENEFSLVRTLLNGIIRSGNLCSI